MIHTETCSILSPTISIKKWLDQDKNEVLFFKNELAIKELSKVEELKQISPKSRAKNKTSLPLCLVQVEEKMWILPDFCITWQGAASLRAGLDCSTPRCCFRNSSTRTDSAVSKSEHTSALTWHQVQFLPTCYLGQIVTPVLEGELSWMEGKRFGSMFVYFKWTFFPHIYRYRNINFLPLSQEISICVHCFPHSRFSGRAVIQLQS